MTAIRSNSPRSRICLIRPAEGIYISKTTLLKPTLPLGLAYVAASIRDAGHDVQVVDAVGEGFGKITRAHGVHSLGLENEEIIRRVDPETRILAIGNMFSHNWPMVRDLVFLLRKSFPDVPIIMGGEHASSLPELVLQQSPTDACILGEGEETAVELIQALLQSADLSSVKGIAHKGPDGSVRRTAPRARIRSVDEIPWPAWDLFNVKAYAENDLTNGMQYQSDPPFMPILATRGCPYQCTFCTSPNMWTTAWIARNPVNVVDEIESYIRQYGARNFRFQDLTAIIRKEWILEFCREVIRRDLKFVWQMPSGTRSEAIDDEVADHLKKAGLFEMAYAPESGSDRVRQLIKKRVKAENLYASVRSAVKAGLHVQVFFVMGFPEETTADLRATLAMIARLAWMRVPDVAIQHYMPYPGTEMYERLLAAGKVKTNDAWLLAPLHTHELFLNKARSVNDHFSPLTQSRYYLAGFMLFYAISILRRPWFYVRSFWGTLRRSSHDQSYLQKLMKGWFGCGSQMGVSPAGTGFSASETRK